jgi:hypothetical protein
MQNNPNAGGQRPIFDDPGFQDQVGVQVDRPRTVGDLIKLGGRFNVEHRRNGKLLGTYDITNAITNEGKNKALNILFYDNSLHPKISDWFIGLIDASGYTGVAAGDTMSSHSGWTELTAYDETLRQEWEPGAAASQSITNASSRTFTMNGTDTVKGIFVCDDSTKSGTSGVLWATALFAADVNVVATDELKITYTVSAS